MTTGKRLDRLTIVTVCLWQCSRVECIVGVHAYMCLPVVGPKEEPPVVRHAAL